MLEKKEKIQIPMMALRALTVFPNMAISFPVGRQKSLDALEAAEEQDKRIFLVAQRDPEDASPEQMGLYEFGTVATIKQILKLPGNVTHVIVEGVERGRLETVQKKRKCEYANVITIAQDFPELPDVHTAAQMRVAEELYEEYIKFVPNTTAVDLLGSVMAARKPGRLADVIAAGLEISFDRKQRLLELLNPYDRLQAVMEIMRYEKQVLLIKREIESKAKENIDRNQREYYLREEMKVIQEELGDKDGVGADAAAFRQRLEEKNPPKEVRETVEKEIDRMLKIPVTSPESNVSRSYIDTILHLPWNEKTEECFDLSEAQKILDEDHYGLKKVKERILEYLAVRKNAPEEKATILCLVGPPGVGKTSIARSVAKALNRKYVRMSLGGIKDEAEIRGHRRTYIGAMPGRIMNAMKQVGTINPLMLLDEVDKLGVSYNGDPAAALLEVLDGEQNFTFRDHYIELPYDLSKVLFMCTANSTEPIPGPLLDRMEVIPLGSYTATEKEHIAMEHLLKKQMQRHGLKGSQLKIKAEAMEKIIDGYTREAGVRQLERTIGQICRKAVKAIISGEKKSMTVTVKNVEEILGKPKYAFDTIYAEPQVGIVRGLAWTAVGGTTLSVEVNAMPGDGKLRLTGNLGKVMKESAEAAMSYIRSQSGRFRLEPDFYKTTDLHIHIPEGATPKDGPSAGVTMTTAMLSALTGAKVRHDVAMTGEVTIRGRVLPIGGLQEKVLAAKKAGVKTVVLPKENEKDLAEISEEIKEGLEFVLAKDMDDVLRHALAKGEDVWK
ncbi:MAG TPA: endopeptidase La [Candidatus Anaerotignum merdipullorum]|nr:endopeptidase La [Candidatus Anaerotignum merdipullorum]